VPPPSTATPGYRTMPRPATHDSAREAAVANASDGQSGSPMALLHRRRVTCRTRLPLCGVIFVHFTGYIRSPWHNFGEACAGWRRQAASYLLRCTTALQTSTMDGGWGWDTCRCTRDRDGPHKIGGNWPRSGQGVLSRRCRAAPGGGSGAMVDRRGSYGAGHDGDTSGTGSRSGRGRPSGRPFSHDLRLSRS
jgi:hypothetical protein